MSKKTIRKESFSWERGLTKKYFWCKMIRLLCSILTSKEGGTIMCIHTEYFPINLCLLAKLHKFTLDDLDIFLGNLKAVANREGKRVPRYFADFADNVILGKWQGSKETLLKADVQLLKV